MNEQLDKLRLKVETLIAMNDRSLQTFAAIADICSAAAERKIPMDVALIRVVKAIEAELDDRQQLIRDVQP